MKNIFDTLKSGNMANVGNTINSALGGKMGNIGESINSAMNNNNLGANAKASMQNVTNNLGGIGGLLGSAAIGGLVGALFSGKSMKKVAKGALTVGGTAAAGALAWKFYQKWSQNQSSTQTPAPDTSMQTHSIPANPTPAELGPEANTALLLLEAMVFAARADGHIDDEERQNIHNAAEALFPGQMVANLLDDFLQKPIDPTSLASKIQNHEEACDLYRLSCAAINIDSFMERSYIDGLAQALKLSEAEKTQLEQEAVAARQAMNA